MKLCVDCKHLYSHGPPYYTHASCTNEKAFPVNLVTGINFNSGENPYKLRADANLCGPDAKHFEGKEKS